MADYDVKHKQPWAEQARAFVLHAGLSHVICTLCGIVGAAIRVRKLSDMPPLLYRTWDAFRADALLADLSVTAEAVNCMAAKSQKTKGEWFARWALEDSGFSN